MIYFDSYEKKNHNLIFFCVNRDDVNNSNKKTRLYLGSNNKKSRHHKIKKNIVNE